MFFICCMLDHFKFGLCLKCNGSNRQFLTHTSALSKYTYRQAESYKIDYASATLKNKRKQSTSNEHCKTTHVSILSKCDKVHDPIGKLHNPKGPIKIKIQWVCRQDAICGKVREIELMKNTINKQLLSRAQKAFRDNWAI